MSWTTRLGNLGRFSPFGRPSGQGSTKVSDADFSYITADDLRRHNAESYEDDDHSSSPADQGPPRDTDILVFRNKRQEYQVHFPAYSIAKGELTVGQVREHAARKVGAGDIKRVKLLYRGKNLKDDSRTCKQEGLRDGAELMVTAAESTNLASPSDSEDEEDEPIDGADDQSATGGDAKRRRNRGKKTKRRNKREDRQGGSSTASPQPGGVGLGVPPSSQPSRGPSPRPAATPTTPIEKLDALHEKLQEYVPACKSFLESPPSDPAKKEFEHKRLGETIMIQVLLKVDAVETEGDADARTRRKELVKEAQDWLNQLDAAMKS